MKISEDGVLITLLSKEDEVMPAAATLMEEIKKKHPDFELPSKLTTKDPSKLTSEEEEFSD